MSITKTQLEALILAGQKMSNICFNLAQHDYIPERERISMKECQQEWDDAKLMVVTARRSKR